MWSVKTSPKSLQETAFSNAQAYPYTPKPSSGDLPVGPFQSKPYADREIVNPTAMGSGETDAESIGKSSTLKSSRPSIYSNNSTGSVIRSPRFEFVAGRGSHDIPYMTKRESVSSASTSTPATHDHIRSPESGLTRQSIDIRSLSIEDSPRNPRRPVNRTGQNNTEKRYRSRMNHQQFANLRKALP